VTTRGRGGGYRGSRGGDREKNYSRDDQYDRRPKYEARDQRSGQ